MKDKISQLFMDLEVYPYMMKYDQKRALNFVWVLLAIIVVIISMSLIRFYRFGFGAHMIVPIVIFSFIMLALLLMKLGVEYYKAQHVLKVGWIFLFITAGIHAFFGSSDHIHIMNLSDPVLVKKMSLTTSITRGTIYVVIVSLVNRGFRPINISPFIPCLVWLFWVDLFFVFPHHDDLYFPLQYALLLFIASTLGGLWTLSIWILSIAVGFTFQQYIHPDWSPMVTLNEDVFLHLVGYVLGFLALILVAQMKIFSFKFRWLGLAHAKTS